MQCDIQTPNSLYSGYVCVSMNYLISSLLPSLEENLSLICPALANIHLLPSLYLETGPVSSMKNAKT